jgi:hypothetical protein
MAPDMNVPKIIANTEPICIGLRYTYKKGIGMYLNRYVTANPINPTRKIP